MKEKEKIAVSQAVLDAVRREVRDGRLTCTAAQRLAAELAVPVREVGAACDALGVKVQACELGCF
ncbi:hypothetical protein [Desulfotomaculum copahuensis]|uniref:Uncharacterized protein n=1 Tax=Desulfotomaculum copahuensis TaxID=1838280 RepID=A0A1B7LF73_9FIRM|nr:hypothetical protein [Desulfotomaculum copahuensis]OAT82287.1 hypothetical protein A6M21_09015 [Desulfotomaculum copahuensis]